MQNKLPDNCHCQSQPQLKSTQSHLKLLSLPLLNSSFFFVLYRVLLESSFGFPGAFAQCSPLSSTLSSVNQKETPPQSFSCLFVSQSYDLRQYRITNRVISVKYKSFLLQAIIPTFLFTFAIIFHMFKKAYAFSDIVS